MTPTGMSSIQEAMTAMPVTISADEQLETAQALFEEYHIHHLPVTEEGRVVGLVSKHMLDVVVAQYPKLGARAAIRMRDIIREVPLLVNTEMSLREVALQMADRGHSAAVVVDGLKVRGIFTVTDACRWIGRTA